MENIQKIFWLKWGTCTTIAFLLSLPISKIQAQNGNLKADSLFYTTFRNRDGSWGYQIIRNQTPIIIQKQIPAIVGNKGFPNRVSAEQTASLVIEKLKHHSGSFPTISKDELIKLKVIKP